MPTRRIIVLLLVLLWPPLAPAAAAQTLHEPKIIAFIATLPELRRLGEQAGAPPEALRRSDDVVAPFAPLITAVALRGAMPAAKAVLSSHGFTTMADWSEVGNRTLRAFVASRAGDPANAIPAPVADARAAVLANADLSPDQQDLMLRQLEKATGTVLRVDVPAADIAAIKPHLAKLRDLFAGD